MSGAVLENVLKERKDGVFTGECLSLSDRAKLEFS